MKAIILLGLFWGVGVAHASERIAVATSAPHNREALVWYRVPCDYEATRATSYPVLVYFGGRNTRGDKDAEGPNGWGAWADRVGAFIVAPGYQDDEYWSPDKWSGRALFAALDQLAATHKVDISRVLYYGYSAGAQAAHLFAAWRPDRCRAWVSHANGVFQAPSAAMRSVPGLVTCGDVDAARYVISRDFVRRARQQGEPIIWKSFPNRPHDVPSASRHLAQAFLAEVLTNAPSASSPYVGDDADEVYYAARSPEAEAIPEEDRVRLPSRAVAEAWGRAAARIEDEVAPEADEQERAQRVRLAVRGTEFVCRLPKTVKASSRIVVLWGGRGWTGDKTLTTFSLNRWAERTQTLLIAPSYTKGDYRRPETGSGDKLVAAIAKLVQKYGLTDRRPILYGYSAGAECAALFAQYAPLSAAAWGVHANGVYPDETTLTRTDLPALITCGKSDATRLNLSRSFAMSYRAKGGECCFKPLSTGHEFTSRVQALAEAWLDVMLHPGPSWLWGEDDTFRLRDAAQIEIESRNPLYTKRLSELWLKQ